MAAMSAPAEKVLTRSEIPDSVKQWFSAMPGSDQIPPLYVRDWLGEVIRRNYRLFFSIAYGYVRDRSRAEDIVQDAVLKALRNLTRVKRPEAIVGWLASITRNACLDLLRDKKPRLTGSLEQAPPMPASDPDYAVKEEQQRMLLAAINDLPENLAIVVRLRFLEECDISAIANRLGLRPNAVEVRLHRALKNLANKDSLKSLKGEYP